MTMEPDQQTIAASWYPDPANSANLRWWDGSGWTDHVMPNPATAPRSPGAHAAQEHGGSSATVPQFTGAAFAPDAYSAQPYTAPVPTYSSTETADYGSTYVPMDVIPATRVASLGAAGPSNTWAIWVFAFLPLIALPAAYFKFELDTTDNYSIIRLVLVAVGIIMMIVFASIDRSILARRDHLRPTSGALGVLPPAYLISRTVKVGASGVAVLLVSVLIEIAIVVYALIRLGIIGGGALSS